MLIICNLANYANMLIKKVAQGCHFGNSAEISLITIKNTNQSKNLVLIDISRSCTQHMGPSTQLLLLCPLAELFVTCGIRSMNL